MRRGANSSEFGWIGKFPMLAYICLRQLIDARSNPETKMIRW